MHKFLASGCWVSSRVGEHSKALRFVDPKHPRTFEGTTNIIPSTLLDLYSRLLLYGHLEQSNYLFQCFYNASPHLLSVFQSRAAPHSFPSSVCQSLDCTFTWQQYLYHLCLTLCPPCRGEGHRCPATPMPSTRPTVLPRAPLL